MSIVIERSFHIETASGRRGGKRHILCDGPERAPSLQRDQGRLPRISRLMALAIHCDRLLRSGKVPDAATMACVSHVTQPRMTQILNLTLLAPDIQEEILHLPPVGTGRAQVHERALRTICSITQWSRQRPRWRALRDGSMALDA